MTPRRSIRPFLLCALALLSVMPCVVGRHSINLPLEMRQPKPLRANSTRGFPRLVRLHEPHPHHPFRWTSRMHDVQLYGGMVSVGEYYAKVHIGGQTLRVQIDTGSATLAVPLKECSNCKRGDMRYSLEDSNSGIAKRISCEDPACGVDTCLAYGCGKCSSKKACCAKMSSAHCAFHLNFGDGSGAQGYLVRDNLKWGDVEFPVTFGGISSDSPDFERSQVDGILGMAYPSLACNPSCIMPTFESMLQKVPMEDMFTICITYDSGTIVLGDYDRAMSTKPISWVALDISNPPSFYSFPLIGNMQINGKDLQLRSYSRAIVDSGTTLVVFSHQSFDKIKKYLLSNFCDVPGLCGPDSWFRPAHCTKISSADLKKMPTLKFPLEGFVITLEPSDYMINYASKGPEFWCVGLMALNAMSGGVDVIFGNTVMKKYVTVYDRANKRVGFALSDTSCGADGRDKDSIPVNDPKKRQGDGKGEGIGSDSDGDDSEGNKPNSGSDDNDGKEPYKRQGSAPQVIIGTCSSAKNCSVCAATREANGGECKWDRSTGQCRSGKGAFLMCTFDSLAGKLVYVIGGGVAAVVAVVAVVAMMVQSYRKRQSAGDEDDRELQQPLARGEVDTASAFALEDDGA